MISGRPPHATFRMGEAPSAHPRAKAIRARGYALSQAISMPPSPRSINVAAPPWKPPPRTRVRPRDRPDRWGQPPGRKVTDSSLTGSTHRRPEGRRPRLGRSQPAQPAYRTSERPRPALDETGPGPSQGRPGPASWPVVPAGSAVAFSGSGWSMVDSWGLLANSIFNYIHFPVPITGLPSS